GGGDTAGDPRVNIGLAPGFVDGKPEVARRDALQLALRGRHPRSLAGSIPSDYDNRRQRRSRKGHSKGVETRRKTGYSSPEDLSLMSRYTRLVEFDLLYRRINGRLLA